MVQGPDQAGGSGKATPRLLQESRETLQRLRLGGPFYVLLWLLSGWASGLWDRARVAYLLAAAVFVAMTVMRFRIRPLPEDVDQQRVRRRLDYIWCLLLANAALWGIAIGWALLTTADESARTVAAISSYAFATAFAHNFPMRLPRALLALAFLYLSTLAALVANGSRPELVGVSFLYLVYVTLALRRSHAEYLQRLDLQDELRRQRDLYEQQSRRDGLTGLANRRRFTAVLDAWASRARAEGTPLALLILDLDRFTDVNDRHGHAAGDASLRAFAALLQQGFPRASDELVARLGGEEFGVLLAGVPLASALERADDFRRRFAETPVQTEGGTSLQLSVSIGVAAFQPHRHHDADALYHAADSALYEAKAAGRNAVRHVPPLA